MYLKYNQCLERGFIDSIKNVSETYENRQREREREGIPCTYRRSNPHTTYIYIYIFPYEEHFIEKMRKREKRITAIRLEVDGQESKPHVLVRYATLASFTPLPISAVDSKSID